MADDDDGDDDDDDGGFENKKACQSKIPYLLLDWIAKRLRLVKPNPTTTYLLSEYYPTLRLFVYLFAYLDKNNFQQKIAGIFALRKNKEKIVRIGVTLQLLNN